MKLYQKITSIAVLSSFLSLPAFSQNTQKLSDPEVASIAVAANQIDIDNSVIAKEKSSNKEVLRFAETMANDHKAVIDRAVALVKKLGVTPEDNAVTQKLLSDSEKTRQDLRTKSGKDFDKSYIDNEVAYHKAVISTVEGLLIPESENSELKQLLQDIMPALQAHLEHAEMVQRSLSK